MNNYNNWDELPLSLNATQISKILRISLPLVYNLFHREDFPAVRVSEKRFIVPKDKFRTWLNNETAKKGSTCNDH